MSTFRKTLKSSSDAFLPEKVRSVLNKDIISDKEHRFYISGWTLFHFAMGIIFGYFVKKYLVIDNSTKLVNNYYYKMLVLHTTWELWQNFIGDNNFFTLSGKGSLVDIIMDTIFFMLGALITDKIFT